jgi:hypothetical protein
MPASRTSAAISLMIAIAVVAIGAFAVGVGTGRSATNAIRDSRLDQPTASDAPVSRLIASPLPIGEYHLSEDQALDLASVVAFYRAYDAGDMASSMDLLSSAPRLADCDYRTGEAKTFVGRSAVQSYLIKKFADRDRWRVEFFQDDQNPVPGQVVIIPIERTSQELAELGVPKGTKTKFPVELAIDLDADHHLLFVDWATGGPGVAKHLCQPA